MCAFQFSHGCTLNLPVGFMLALANTDMVLQSANGAQQANTHIDCHLATKLPSRPS